MKKLIALCLVGSMALTLAACGGANSGDSETSSPALETTQEPTPNPIPDLTGVWTQVDAGDRYQQATIQGDTIEINWIGADGTSALYWAGSFIAPTTEDEPYTWTSANDTSKTSGALMASGDETKDFTYEDGKISYSVSMMGITNTMQLEKTDNVDESNVVESDAINGTSFANGVLTTDEYIITITDYKVIQPGDTGNEYGDVPVIAFWYDTTNTGSDSDISASVAWIMEFEAIQDNDPNVVNTLNMAPLPDNQFLDSQIEPIKEGGTVSNAVAYELDDVTTPVTLVASNMMDGEYGRQEFSLNEAGTESLKFEDSGMTVIEFASAIEKSLNQGVTSGSSAKVNGENITITYCFEGTSLLATNAEYWKDVKETSMAYYQTVIDSADAMGLKCSIVMNVVDTSNADVPLLTIEEGAFTYDAAT